MSNQTNGFQRSFTGEGLKVNTVFVYRTQRITHPMTDIIVQTTVCTGLRCHV